MQDYLIVKGQIGLIENATTPSIVKPEEWNRKDRVARATIQMHLSESVYYRVESCATAHALWQKLVHIREKNGRNKYLSHTTSLQSADERV